jgi:RNA polymerase sigma-70 factor, ECF subfamily
MLSEGSAGDLRPRLQAMGRLRAGTNMKGWLFTILRNVWFNQLRKQRSGPQMVEIAVGDGAANSIAEPSKDGSYDVYVSKMEAEQVRAAIQELSLEFREIILLREYEELFYLEIASVLDCPVGTVMSRLGRARAKLRVALSETMKGSVSEGHKMKDCRIYGTTIVQLYLDKELSGRDLEEFRTHLEECEACQAEVEAEEELPGLLHRSRLCTPHRKLSAIESSK